jgi:hypothetical protein
MTKSITSDSLASDRLEVIENLDISFEFLGIPQLAQRFNDICITASKANQAIERSERAKVLGLFDPTADRSLLATRRYRDAAVRSLRSTEAMIEEHLTMPQWKKALAIAQSGDPRQGDPNQILDELGAEVRDQLLNSNLSPAVSGQILEIVDRSIDVGRQGLEPTMDLVRQSLTEFAEQFQSGSIERRLVAVQASDNMLGSQALDRDRDVPAYLLCTGAAVAVFIAGSIACAYIPFCWCCIFPLLLAGFLAWIEACENL